MFYQFHNNQILCLLFSFASKCLYRAKVWSCYVYLFLEKAQKIVGDIFYKADLSWESEGTLFQNLKPSYDL